MTAISIRGTRKLYEAHFRLNLKEIDQNDQTPRHDKKDQQKETKENQEEETEKKKEIQVSLRMGDQT